MQDTHCLTHTASDVCSSFLYFCISQVFPNALPEDFPEIAREENILREAKALVWLIEYLVFSCFSKPLVGCGRVAPARFLLVLVLKNK